MQPVLVIRVEPNMLKILETDQQLFISGAREKLDIFSENIDWFVDSQPEELLEKQDHMHVEYSPGHFFLSEDALPLILIRRD